MSKVWGVQVICFEIFQHTYRKHTLHFQKSVASMQESTSHHTIQSPQFYNSCYDVEHTTSFSLYPNTSLPTHLPTSLKNP